MPITKGAASDFTTYQKNSAQTLGPGLYSRSGVALIGSSAIAAQVRASQVSLTASTNSVLSYNIMTRGNSKPSEAQSSGSALQPPSPPVITFTTIGAAIGTLTITAASTATSYSALLYSNVANNSTTGTLVSTTPITNIATPTTFSLTSNLYYYVQCYSSNAAGLSTTYTTSAVITLPPPGLPLTTGGGFLVKYNTAGVAQWAIAIIPTNSGGDIVSTATDSTGLYAGGYYNSSTAISLYNGDGSSSIKTLPAQISSYVVKYNTAGAVQWAATITGGSLIYQVATDSTGVYVCGRFTSSAALINADGSASGKSFPGAVVQDAFVLKYNTSGLVQWCAVIQGDSYDETHAVATDSTGIYVSGLYRSTTTTGLNNADGSASGKSFGASQGGGGLNTFVVKYNTSGAIQWAISIPTQTAEDHAIATDSSGVYATSSYTGTASIALNNGDGSASVKSLPVVGANATNAFIVKYNSTSTGLVQWYTTIPTANTVGYSSTIYGAATDSTGVYITGSYYSGASTISLINGDGSGSGKSLPAPVGGAIPVFVVKLNTAGTVQWALVIQGTSDGRGAGVATDSTGVYVSGYYSSTATVPLTNGSGSASGKSLPISLGRDGFTVKYDTSGAVQWYTTTRGTSDSDKGNTVITDSSGVYTAGYYISTTAVALPNGV